MREVREFLVRVFGQQDSVPSGCGFLVGSGRQHIFTCCHVVNDALGRSDRTRPLEPLYVDFPFLAAKRHIRAEVVEWHYDLEDRLNDIAVLKLQEPVPNGARSATFVTSDDYSGDTFRAFGFPRGLEDDGREVKGVLGAAQVNGRVLAEGISQFGYFIEPGFSGAPIWNTTRKGVCGMAFQVDTPVEVKVASFIPTQLLKKAAPALVEASSTGTLDPVVEQYLHGLITDLEKRMGVLQYVDLSGTAEEPDKSASQLPFSIEEFGFSEIVEKPDRHRKRETIPLGNIRDAINKHSRFVLIGDAGSSKTTTIRRLALDAAQKKLDQPDAPLPLLLYLPRWKDEATAEDFVRMQWRELQLPADVDPIALLQQGEATLYLDGLNEMGGDGADNAKKLKAWFQSTSKPVQVIVTCRKDSYSEDFELDLPVVQVEPLSDEQIKRFVQNYLGDRATNLLERLMSDDEPTQDTRHLYHLAKNPYMLSALIVVFDTSPEQELPRNNGKLMQMLVRALAKREAQRNSLGWTPLEEKLPHIESELARLAFSMIDDNKGTEVSIEYASKFVDKELLRTAKSADLVQTNGTHVRFYHQLIQEYFAAVKLVKVDLPNAIMLEFYGYPYERKSTLWDNVVIAASGIKQTNADEWIIQVLNRDGYLAYFCCQNNENISETTLSRVARFLVQERKMSYQYHLVMTDIRGQDYYYNALDIEKMIIQIGAPSIKPLLMEINDPIPEIRAAMIDLLGQLNASEAIQAIERHLNDHGKLDSWDQTVSFFAETALKHIGTHEALKAISDWQANRKTK